MKREIVLDTETTGLDPATGHRIVEIGCVELISGVRTGKEFHTYLNPERDMPEEAERVHGISGRFLQDKPVFAEKVDDFLEFIAESTLVIHNAGFDMRFINAELARLGFGPIPMERTIDTVLMARKKFPGSPASLDALCKRFNVDLSGREKHGALLDAQLLADVYLELLGGRQAMMLLEEEAEAVELAAQAARRTRREPRDFRVPAEELEAHAAMVEKLKNAIWAES
ncbi:MAG: DNA polymerase III subunit epsilon [Alphaproteobacteria bacterium]|nr:DNA polymerase III subunit epsilon [Alphaproteobacteria bacterium]